MRRQLPGTRRAGSVWRWACIVFAAVMVLAVQWLALVAAPRERERSVGHWREQLSSVADDRKAALDRWLYERVGDAKLLAANRDVAAWVLGAGGRLEPAIRRQIDLGAGALLESIVDSYGYRTAMLLDRTGRTLISRGLPLDAEQACILKETDTASAGVLADACLYAGTTPVVEFAAPIRAAGDSDPVGAALVVVDPTEWLYPFVARQAFRSESMEALLVRRDGNTAQFLTPLSHLPDPPMTFRRSLHEPGLPAAAALAGMSIFTESLDYRGVPVLAVTRMLTGVPWGLVVKIDRAEALAGYRQWLRGTLELLAFLVVALAGVGYGLWHRERRLVQAAAIASEARFAAIIENVQDAYFRVGLDGRIIMASPSAARIYNFASADEMIGTPMSALYADPAVRDAVLEEIRHHGRCHDRVGRGRRRDGSEFYVSLNAQFYRDEEGRIAGTEGFVRDISERERAKEMLRESEERFRTVANYTYDWEYWLAPDRTTLYMSPSCERVTGYRAEEFLGDPDLLNRIVVAEDRHVMDLHRAVAWLDDPTGGLHETDFRILRRDGEMRWIRHVCQIIRQADGTSLGLRATNRDISERKAIEEALRESEAYFREVFDSTAHGIFIIEVDEDGSFRIGDCNKAEEIATTIRRDDVMGKPLEQAFPPDIAAALRTNYSRCLEAGVPIAYEEGIELPGVGFRHYLTTLAPVRDTSGRFYRIIGSTLEITDRKRMEETLRQLNARLHDLAMTDELTGVPNRRSFFDRGAEELKRFSRYKTPFSVLMLDIDDFKRINDAHGHDAGDRALHCLADELRRSIRETDFLARLGGEEFGVILPNTGLVDAGRVAEKMRLSVEDRGCSVVEGVTMNMTLSAGVATATTGVESFDVIVKNADVALYEAKNQGKNKTVLWSG